MNRLIVRRDGGDRTHRLAGHRRLRVPAPSPEVRRSRCRSSEVVRETVQMIQTLVFVPADRGRKRETPGGIQDRDR